jgi:hypothetical protein
MVWADINGRTRLSYVNTNGGGAAIQTALEAKSNAQVQNSVDATATVVVPAPTAATYQSVADVAVLVFVDASNYQTEIVLPAPQASIFLADGETVDITQIGTIIAAVVGTAETSTGGLVTAFLGGYRATKKGVLY